MWSKRGLRSDSVSLSCAIRWAISLSCRLCLSLSVPSSFLRQQQEAFKYNPLCNGATFQECAFNRCGREPQIRSFVTDFALCVRLEIAFLHLSLCHS